VTRGRVEHAANPLEHRVTVITSSRTKGTGSCSSRCTIFRHSVKVATAASRRPSDCHDGSRKNLRERVILAAKGGSQDLAKNVQNRVMVRLHIFDTQNSPWRGDWGDLAVWAGWAGWEGSDNGR